MSHLTNIASTMDSSKGCIVLVTGGSGFLGQHVVGLLQERANHVTGIRVLDVIPYKNKLDYAERVPVQQFVGSVVDTDLVQRACKGVDCVMHVASIVDTSLIPDEELSYKINVVGTKNVVAACQKNGVKRLLYCSTSEVVAGTGNIYDGTEDTTEYATSHLFKAYGSTKIEAERIVLEANCNNLKTLALRPAVMYGELEWRSLGRNSVLAQKMGCYVRIDCKNGLAEHVYVGNVAWGFVSVENNFNEGKIQQSSTGCGYFIVDDSPRKSITAFMDIIFLEIGLKPLPLTLPLWLFVFPLYILFFLLSLISIVHRVNLSVGIAPFMALHRICLFRYEKARKYLGYKPLFSYDDAKQRTVNFFQPCPSTHS